MKYAIIRSGGKQYRCVEGGAIEVDRLPVEAGATHTFNEVLLVADDDAVTIGAPTVALPIQPRWRAKPAPAHCDLAERASGTGDFTRRNAHGGLQPVEPVADSAAPRSHEFAAFARAALRNAACSLARTEWSKQGTGRSSRPSASS